MAKIYGQLEKAQLENTASDLAAGIVGSAWFNTTDGKMKIADGTLVRAMLRNDGKAVVGNSGTASDNIRLHRGAVGVLQFVSGADVTAEGTLSTALNQLSFKAENYTTGALPTFGNAGRIAFNTTTSFLNFDTGAAWKEVVDANTVQDLTNKTLITPTVEAAALFEQIATPTTPASGFNKIYPKSDGKWYNLSPTGIEETLGAGGAGINYITNPDGTSTTGWAAYADAAGTTPVNGTGGSPTITLTASGTNPLRGVSSFLLTKDAANRQGEGVSTDFTIDRVDQTQLLQISFDYQIASGTYADGDLRVFLYDVTNSQVLELSVRNVPAINTFATFQSFVQAPVNSTSYRLIIHVATTSALAYTFKFDNVRVGPAISASVGGTIVAAKYTEASGSQTFADNTITTMILGTKSYDTTNSFNTATGEYTVPETGIYKVTGIATQVNGTSMTAGNQFQLILKKNTVVDSYMALHNVEVTASPNGRGVSGSADVSCVKGDILEVAVYQNRGSAISLLSDSTGVQVSFFKIDGAGSGASGGVVAAAYSQNSNLAVTASTAINFADKVFDTNAGYSAGTYTVPQTGYYQINTRMFTASANALYLYVNGVIVSQGSDGSASEPATVSELRYLVAGDLVTFRPLNSGTTSGGGYLTNFSMVQVTNPTAIQPNQLVVAKYSCTTTPSFTTLATIVYDTKVQDTHAAYNSSTGVFTAPVTGTYSFSANAVSSSVFGGGQNWDFFAYKNGSIIEGFDWIKGSGDSNTVRSVKASSTVQLAAGDTFEIQTQTSGTTITLAGSTLPSLFSIFLIN
jgi:hypothetical protein